MSVCVFFRRVSFWSVTLFLLSSLCPFVEAQEEESDWPPVVTIVAVDHQAREQSPYVDALPDTAELRMHRTGDVAEPMTVFYLVGGTATNGKDYVRLEGELQLPAGERTASLFIIPLDDDEVEPVETVVVTVIPKEIAPDGELQPGYYHVGIPETARAMIMDDDGALNLPPSVAITSPPPGAILPLDRKIHIMAEARDPDGWITAVEFFADGQSIGVARGQDGSPETTEPADVFDHPDWRPPHVFQVGWENPTPGPHVLMAVAEDNLGEKAESTPVEVHLLDTLEPTVVHVIASDPHAAEGPLDDTLAAIPDPARFTLVRSGPVDFPLPVYFELGGTAVNGVDYLELANSAVILEGERSVDVIIDPIDDSLPERTETVTLTVIPPVCIEIWPPPPECYLVGRPAVARAYIRDNDSIGNQAPRVRLVAPRDGQVLRAPAEVRLTAVAWDEDGGVVTVEFFAGNRSLGIVDRPDPVPLPTDDQVQDPSLGLPRYSLLWSDVPPGSYTLTALATDTQGMTTLSAPARLWVIDPSDLQVVTVEATDPDAAEPSNLTLGADALDTGLFTIQRTGSMEEPLTVYYHLDGTALNGIDYEELPQLTVIPAGMDSVQLEVRPLHDELVEGIEHVELRLLPICCRADPDDTRPGPPYVVGDPASARVAIHDDDAHGNVPPRIKLARPIDGQVFVRPREIELVAVVQDPDGWVPEVQFFAGEMLIGTSRIVFIREPDPGLPQTFSIIWSNVPPGRHELTARAVDDQGAMTTSRPIRISVREPAILPVVTIEATDPRASEGGVLAVVDSALFTVQRSGDQTAALHVSYSIDGTAENGVDYALLSGVIEIPAHSASATIEIYPLPDRLVEGVETVILELEAPVCPAIFPPPPGCYMVGEPSWALAGIVDGPASGNLPPRVEIIRPFPGAVFHALAAIPVVAQARDQDGFVTRVEWFANDRKIGEQNLQFITPPPPGDRQLFEFDWRNVPVGEYRLTARATDELGAVSKLSEAVAVVVLPADEVPVVTLFVDDPIASETPNADGSMDTATFKVRRSGALDLPLTVFYELRGTAENGLDYVALREHVTIPSGSRWARITVVPMSDALVEEPETVVMELVASALMGPIESYQVGKPSLAAGLILDAGVLEVPTKRIRDWLHIQLPGEAGAVYRLEVSEDLREWQALTEGTADDSGMHHVEASPEDSPRRFYRLLPLSSELMVEPTIHERDW